jgi:hypothetical protein
MIDLSLRLSISKTAASSGQWFRIPHDVERVDFNAEDPDLRYRGNVPEYAGDPRGGPPRKVVLDRGAPMPEVYLLDPLHHTVLDCACQRMWKDLNPELGIKRQSALYGNGLAVTNNTGFPGHYNCLTGEDQDQVFPRFDKPRLFGGAVVLGMQKGERVYFSSMLVSDPIRSGAEVLEHKEWWCYWTSINPEGEIHYITRPSGPNSDGPNVPVRLPFLTTVQVSLPAVELHRLPAGFIPPSAMWMP